MKTGLWLVVMAACGGGGGEAIDAARGGDGPMRVDAPVDGGSGGDSPWTNRTPDPLPRVWPSARSFHGLAFDSTAGVTVMFGGADFPPTDANISDEVWEWDGSAGTFTDRTPTPRPASWPPPSVSPAVAFDAGRGRTFVYGGLGPPNETTFDRRVWEWNSAAGTFADRTPSPLPASWPPDGELATAVYDSDRAIVVAVLGDRSLWEWDGAAGTWTDRTPSPLPAAWPSGRQGEALAYDAVAHRTLLFGGRVGQTNFDDLWAWDGTDGTWTDLTPAPLPPAWPDARTRAALSFDATTGFVELYGGLVGTSPVTDLWTWDGATSVWTDRTPAALPEAWPAPHGGPAMVYDAGRLRQVLFGGLLTGNLSANDVWDLED